MAKATKTTEAIEVIDTSNDTYLAGMNPAEVVEYIDNMLEGEQLSPFDLPRVTVPAGGGTMFMVPSLEDEDGLPQKTITGVICHTHFTRTYWSKGFSGEGIEPDCSSQDAITGMGNPGGNCATCAMAEWESAVDDNGKPGKGQACKKQRLIYLFQKGESLPILVNVPPSSLQAVKRYFLRLGQSRVHYTQVETEISLEKATSSGGIGFSRMSFRALGSISSEEAGAVKAFGSTLKAD